MTNLPHIKFYNKSSNGDETDDGMPVEIIDLAPIISDNEAMSSWAKHLRNLYCEDDKIDSYRDGIGKTRSEYLAEMVFPDLPMTISGDFSEIIVSDYIEYVLNYYVPKYRYKNKINRNISTPGVDCIGFKYADINRVSQDDELITCEVKASLSSKDDSTLQSAIDDSENDYILKTPESLNAIKQRLLNDNKQNEAKKIARFQNPIDQPYKFITAAVAVHSNDNWSDEVVTNANAGSHLNKDNLYLFVIKGDLLMDLAKNLYKKACDEA